MRLRLKALWRRLQNTELGLWLGWTPGKRPDFWMGAVYVPPDAYAELERKWQEKRRRGGF